MQATSGARLFRNDVFKGRPGENRKKRVVQDEEAQVPSRLCRDRGTHAPNDEWDHERQEEEREQELAGSARNGHGGEQRSDGGETDVGEQDGCDERCVDRCEEERERGQRHELCHHEKPENAGDLSEPDRASIAGREHEPVKKALLSFSRERARKAEKRSMKYAE